MAQAPRRADSSFGEAQRAPTEMEWNRSRCAFQISPGLGMKNASYVTN